MTTSRALVYVRLSSYRGDADPTTSPQRQRESCEAYARAKDWDVVDVVEDLDVSGSDKGLRLDRPGLLRVREQLSDVDVVIFAKLDRLARNVVDFRAFAEEAAQWDVALVSVAESLDLTTPSGRFVATILAAFAEMEAAMIATRITEGVAGAIALRRHVAGRAPFGYRTVPHASGRGVALAPDPATAPIVRELVARVAAGSTLYAEVQRLNDEGVPSARGARWSTYGVQRLVTSDVILGRLVHRGEPVRDENGLPEQVWEPLVSVADVMRIRARYPSGKSGRAKHVRASRLLSGIVRCSACGHTLNVSGRADARRYACTARQHGRDCAYPVAILADETDEHVEREFLKRVGAFRVTRIEVIEPTSNTERAQVETAISETADQLTKPGVDVAVLVERLTALRARREALAKLPVRPETRIVETGETFAQEWRAADVAGRRELLASAVDSVIIRPGVKGKRSDYSERVVLRLRS